MFGRNSWALYPVKFLTMINLSNLVMLCTFETQMDINNHSTLHEVHYSHGAILQSN